MGREEDMKKTNANLPEEPETSEPTEGEDVEGYSYCSSTKQSGICGFNNNRSVNMSNSRTKVSKTTWIQILIGSYVSGLIMKLLVGVIIEPLLVGVLKLMLTVSGYQLAFNNFIIGFFVSIPGLIGGTFILLLSVWIIYYEFAVIILFASAKLNGQQISIFSAMRRAFIRVRRLKISNLFGYMIYLLLLIPYVNGGISSTLLPILEIPNFITGELMKFSWGNPLWIVVNIIIFLAFLSMIFVLPFSVIEGDDICATIRKNYQYIRCNKKKSIILFIVISVYKILAMSLERVFIAPVFGYTSANLKRLLMVYGVSKELIVLSGIVFVTGITLFCLKPMMLIFVTSIVSDIFSDRKLDLEEEVEKSAGSLAVWVTKKLRYLGESKKIKKSVIVVTVLLLVGYGFVFFVTYSDLHEPIVVGHRGSSSGIENSVEAVQGAIDAEADYAEIDVYLSKDKIPIISHDVNLKRLAGEDINVYDKTAEELKKLTLIQNGKEGTIYTLEEMLEFCTGKIRLAIELKTYGDEGAELAEKVLEIVEKSKVLDQVIFLSLDYDLIMELKNLNSEAVVGYCVYQNVGKLQSNILVSMDVDFIVIEEAMADYETIYNFRKAWIPVYVWTVNDTSNMQKYLEMGAIGIVSDEPQKAKEVIDMFLEISEGSYLEQEEWR